MVDTSQMGPIQNNYIHNKGNIITVILLLEYFLVKENKRKKVLQVLHVFRGYSTVL